MCLQLLPDSHAQQIKRKLYSQVLKKKNQKKSMFHIPYGLGQLPKFNNTWILPLTKYLVLAETCAVLKSLNIWLNFPNFTKFFTNPKWLWRQTYPCKNLANGTLALTLSVPGLVWSRLNSPPPCSSRFHHLSHFLLFPIFYALWLFCLALFGDFQRSHVANSIYVSLNFA